jgi:membrane-associated phospholipid phosphatase
MQEPKIPSQHVDEQEMDGEQKPPTVAFQENTQEIIEGAQQEVEAARLPWYLTIRRGRVLLVLYTLLLILFGSLAWWVHYNPVLAIDVTITREFQENQAPWLKYTMLAISYPGSVFLISIGFLVLAGAILWLVRLRLEAVILVAFSVISSILNGLLKLLVERPRPTANLVDIFQAAGGKSFPSGHVMAYIAFWGFLFSLCIILFKGKTWWRITLLIISALFVILVGFSRVYLGAHWASDVLGSYLIGGVLLGITLWIYLQLKERGILARKEKEEPGTHDSRSHNGRTEISGSSQHTQPY